MIIIVPKSGAPAPRGAALPWPFELDHRRRELRPGGGVDEALSRPGERHLHAIDLPHSALCTFSLESAAEVELWLLGHDRAVIEGPGRGVQALLAAGIYWVQVAAAPGVIEASYRLRMHRARAREAL